MIKGFTRHKILYGILRTIASPIICLILNFKGQIIDRKDPYIVVANHNTDWDSLMLGVVSRRQIYFVASEHIFRKGFASKLLRWALNPIARLKGRTEYHAAMDTVRRIRAGANVGIFGEGNRSFNGRTGRIHRSTGKLVKSCNCRLITYKLIGGYMTTPRWAKTRRRGKLRGIIVGDYPKEEISKMHPDEIMQILARDLQEDAYDRQLEEQVRFKGRDLAESIETSLYTCPKCQSVDTLKSHGNDFSCSKCGTSDTIDEFGFFTGSFGYRTVSDWDRWQDTQVEGIAERITAGMTVSDENISLYKVDPNHEDELLTTGTLTLSNDQLVVGDRTIPLSEIREIGLIKSDRIFFGADNVQYEVRAPRGWCARKYFAFIVALNHLPYTN